MLSISKNLRSKGLGHYMTKYGLKCTFGATTPLKMTVGTFSIKMTCWGSVKHFWKFKGQRSRYTTYIYGNGHNLTKYGTEYCLGVMAESDAH